MIPVFGVDATDTAKELIATGRMTGTIKQDAVGMADAIATIATNIIAGEDKFANLNESYEIVDNWKVNIPYAVLHRRSRISRQANASEGGAENVPPPKI